MRFSKILFPVFLVGFVFTNTSYASPDKYWQQFEEALQDGLPRTAIEYLDKIIEVSQKEKNYGEWMTALTEKIVLEATIQGNRPEEKVKRLKQELETADKQTRPFLQTILAHWYWHYFKRNRYRFMQRTQTLNLLEDDFTTWDLRKIFKEIDSLYQDVLREKEILSSMPINKYLDFLEPGNTPIAYRPTLFDFIAHEALGFYTCAEQAAAMPEDAFEIDANSDAFGPTITFVKYEPVTGDTGSPKLKAIRIYQSLLEVHLRQNNVEALIDLELHRFRYVKNVSFGEEKNRIYIQRLSELNEKYKDVSLSSLVAFSLAQAWGDEDTLVKAYEIAQHGYERFPKTFGGEACKAYMTQLIQKYLSLQREDCISPQPSKIYVTYKNFTTLYFRIYHDKWDAFMEKEHQRPNHIDTLKLRRLLAQDPYKAWSVELPATDDLKLKSMEIDLPELEPGYYRIIASWQEDFENSSMVQHTWLWVSNMTLVTRTRPGLIDGFVLDIVTGEPIEDVAVTQVIRKEKIYVFADKTYSNTDGYFKFKIAEKRTLYTYLYLKKKTEEFFHSAEIHGHSHDYRSRPQTQTFFFTDRSLYRPGQTIYFKGICVRIDNEKKNYEVISKQHVTVYFRDVNRQEVARATFVTNDFGSFSGHFIAPKDRLTGRMSISADEPHGLAGFNIEEYKRPKFFVEIGMPKEASRLNQDVEVTGTATAYTGAPIDNASLRYRVLRTARYPYWWDWYYPYYRYSSKTQLITHGQTQTDDEGKFTITFFAQPDPHISPDDDPRFIYSIYADVTSPDGETRSADTRVTLGYSALAIHLSTEGELQNNQAFSLQVATQTLDGNDLPGEATVQIYRLKEPLNPIPEKLWSSDYRYLEQRSYQTDEHFSSDWNTWPKDTVVYETYVSTREENPKALKASLPVGLYKVECLSKDEFGKEVKAFLPLMVLPDWDKKKFEVTLPSVTEVKSNVVEVGGELEALWGTGYETGRCFIEIEHDRKIIKNYWSPKEHTQHTFNVPVTEKLRGGFVVHLTHVRENRAYMKHLFITVPWDNKELLISRETFRDELQPGEREKITLKISGKKKRIAAAEMVAAMYDFSLDQFYVHSWTGFNFFKRYRSVMHSMFANRAGGFSRWRSTWNPDHHYPVGRTFIHFPDYVARDFLYYRFPAKAMIKYSEHKDSLGNYGKIIGRVMDAETGEPLVGADVIIEGTELGAATDETGHFVIPYVPAGTYRICASYIGYDPFTYTNVKSLKGCTTTVEFRLRSQTIQMEAITCVAERPEIVVSQTSTGRAVTTPELARLAVTTLQAGLEKVPTIDLRYMKIRRDLNETAFFYPHLLMNKDGTVSMEFTMPEALTKWKFLGFTHGKKCENGAITEYVVTKKELMVQPNPPRFLREEDTVYFTAKVINMSDKLQKGRVQLDFKDLVTDKPLNNVLGIDQNVYVFDVKPRASETFAWKIYIPRGTNPVSYTVVAKTKTLSDGEAGAIPVLSNRVFLTETCPLHVRGKQTKEFSFDRLKEIDISETIDPYRLTVQIASNPSWYAIQALPYLIESQYECSEQIFNRYYANSLARYITNSDPRIRDVFEQWRGTEALMSNLEKNEDLKSVLITETPWVRQARTETEAKQRIGMLFEENTVENNLNSAFSKLKNMQRDDGSWTWFPGGESNAYITLYITTGFGRLRYMGVHTDMSLALHSLDYLDRWIKEIYDQIVLMGRAADNNLTPRIAFYLYGRSFFLNERSIPRYAKEAVDYFLQQAEQYWLELNSRMSQGYLSLALHRFNKSKIAEKIMVSIKERSVHSDEMGMFWREDERSWWWYRAPIETQALMIEAFSEVTNDTIAVEECKVWLLKQKQTQHWKTTKATADVVYALILRGADYLASKELVQVKLGDFAVTPEKIEVGTNSYEMIFLKDEILPEFSNITVTKEDKGIAWGGVYFQYFEDMEKVTPQHTNLQLDKEIFINRETKQGRFIEPLTGPLKVGDLITNRITLRVDRDMEYIHLKDFRGSGLEPVDVLSGYRYQDGLRYYQSIKDVASHFFIDYLPRGTYVFEYNLRVQLKGQYQSGIAEIQCMYAPEFCSHSQSKRLNVE